MPAKSKMSETNKAESEFPRLQKILLPTDFSGCANYALPYAAAIVRVAQEQEVDLIVISSHGRTGLGRILFGSTAEAVVRHASCPVLVVKPSHQEEPEEQ